MSMFTDAHNFHVSGGQFNNVQGNQYNVSQVPMDVGQKLFSKLNPVMDAYISPQKICLDGTRTEIINKVTEWAFSSDDNASQIFVLHGPAGTGKSAISHTIGKRFKNLNCLGAFFSFDRTFAAERTPSRAIHSIAYNLGLHSEAFGRCLVEVMPDKDPYVLSSSTMEEEWEKLIVNPAKMVCEPGPVVIIIDALDECAAQKVGSPREKLISLLFNRVHGLPQQFRILVTSRLEYDVGNFLEQCSEGVQIQDMTTLKGTQEDIYAYVCKQIGSPVHIHGLDDTQCKLLAERAEGLFQWAYTVCEVIVAGPQGGTTVKKQFDHFMSLAPSFHKGLQPLDILYKFILQENFDCKDEKAMEEYRMVLSQILAASLPLLQSSLKKLQSAYCQYTGDVDTQESVDLVIPYLGSLFTGVDNRDIPVRPIHTSVRDFLLDESRSGEYAIDLSGGHNTMGIGAIQLMTEKLHFNMCNLPSSYLRNSEVKDLIDRILQGISEDLAYACYFWDIHLIDIKPSQSVLNLVKRFLYYFSLYWMEVLSILGEVATIQRSLKTVTEWIQLPMISPWAGILKLLIEEMKHFVDIFGRVMVEATPHMYLSALTFIPSQSILQNIYCSHFSKTAVLCSGQMIHWPSLEVVLEGHGGSIHSVAFSPDGKKVASGSWDKSVRIWNTETGKPEGNPLQGHTDAVTSVAFSPDGKRIVSGSYDKTVRIWNAETGKAEGNPLQGHTDSVASVGFSPDGKKIVSGSYDKSVRIWNAEIGKANGKPLQGHTDSVASVAFSPDGKKVVTGSWDKSIRIWNAETGKAEGNPLQGHTGSVDSVAFSPDGKKIVSGSYDKSVRIWNVVTGKAERDPLQGHKHSVISVAFSPDGMKIVSGSYDKSVRIWNAEAGKAEGNPLQGHTGSVNSVAFSPDGKKIVSGSSDHSVRIWNAVTDKAVGNPLQGHTDSVNSVAFSPDGKKIVSGSSDHSVRIWNADTGKAEGNPLQGHTDSVISVAFSSDGKKIVSGSDDRSVRIWNAETELAEGNPLQGHTHPVTSVVFSLDGKKIVSGSHDHSVRIWNAETGKADGNPRGCWGSVHSVAFSPDGKTIVSGSDCYVNTWNVASGKARRYSLESTTTSLASVALSPDGKKIVSGSWDNCVMIYNADTGKAEGNRLQGHTRLVKSVAFSPDGKKIVSGSYDKSVRIWNAETGKAEGKPLQGHTDSVTSVAFSPDGKKIASGSWDNSVRIWNAETEKAEGNPLQGHTYSVNSVAFSLDGNRNFSGSSDNSLSITGASTSDTGPSPTNVQHPYSLSLCPWDHGHHHCLHSSQAFQMILFQADGWLCGSDSSLMLWIPPESRYGLSVPPLQVLISSTHMTSLNLRNFVHGTNWAQCYTGLQMHIDSQSVELLEHEIHSQLMEYRPRENPANSRKKHYSTQKKLKHKIKSLIDIFH